jgi:dienelactone hydrolase
VVLVHGTFGNMTDSWQVLSPLLANHGYCVFALDYGGPPGDQIQATGDIPTSAAQLGAWTGCSMRRVPARSTWSATHRAA